MEFVFEVVLLSCVGALGIIGNVAAICLFSRQSIQLKFHRLMMMLATYDLFYILLSLILFTVPQISEAYNTSGAHFYVLPRALPLAQMSLTGSVYSTLAITVERYLIVCHPFYTISHKWAAKRYIIPIVLFSFLYNLPKFFELTTGMETTNATDALLNEGQPITKYTIEPTTMRVNEYYIKIYCIWMNFAFMGLLPFCLLIILNALTLRSLIVQNKSTLSNEFSMSKKNEIALAKVSLTICLIFILCHSVKWIPNLYELARLATEDKRAWPAWVESVTHISHFLMTVNSSVNFYVYCVKHYKLLSKCCDDSISGSGSLNLIHTDIGSVSDQHRRSSANSRMRRSSTWLLNKSKISRLSSVISL